MNSTCFILVLSISIIFYFYICAKLIEIFDNMSSYNISIGLKLLFRILIIFFTIPFFIVMLVGCLLFALVMLIVVSFASLWALITALIH